VSDAPSDESVDGPDVDLAAIERDLIGVEEALSRLDDGSYWTSESTGEPIPDDDLAANPVTRGPT
jgi:RNA polymerase-binding transcription factor DksA